MKSTASKDDVLRKDLANANQTNEQNTSANSLKPPALQLQSSDPTQSQKTDADMTAAPYTMKDLGSWKGDMVRTMLAEIGYDKPEQYFQEMVSINFLGKRARKIRPEFARVLKTVESKLCEQLYLVDPSLSDPAEAGRYLGIDEEFATIRGLKPEKAEYQSMHLFGLAIDINLRKNPWITQKKKKKKPLKKVIRRMDALFNTSIIDDYRYQNANKEVSNLGELEEIYDSYANLDKSFERYFSLMDDDEQLQAALAASESRKWKKMSVRSAKKQIKEDRRVMAKQWSRKRATKELKHRGIMDMDKRLVMAMGAEKLDWGGKYGDMMHFDMRFTGFGEKIQKTKKKSKVRKLKKEIKLLRQAEESGFMA
ncbi:MAG: M15 family metallopeptidase [Bacteroidota bacterium]